MTADRLTALGLIDGIVPEPIGGAHRDAAKTSAALKAELIRRFAELDAMSLDERLAKRFSRYRGIGRFRAAPVEPAEPAPQIVPPGDEAQAT